MEGSQWAMYIVNIARNVPVSCSLCRSESPQNQDSLVSARLSRSKERAWSNCILCFVLICPRNPWRVNWFIYSSAVLWLPAKGGLESLARARLL